MFKKLSLLSIVVCAEFTSLKPLTDVIDNIKYSYQSIQDIDVS